MKNFTVQFTYPWLLLLLIPAAALTAFLFLRLNKRYRKNRNRIVSLVLHSIVMVLCIFALSGITFNYQVSNSQNELILLVDVSDTTEETKERKEDFIRVVLNENAYNECRVGIVTFGFTQQEAVPLTFSTAGAFSDYLSAPLPDDTSATDIAAALQYARSLFEHPESGKIILISDGKETDESALSVIRSIASQGMMVDTVYFPSDYENETVQITGIGLPDYNVKVGSSLPVEVFIESRESITDVTVELYDNGELSYVENGTQKDETGSVTTNLALGAQSVRFDHVFHAEGLHELYAKIEYFDEALQVNNEYYSYRWLQVHDRVLILEQADQSQRLVNMLEEDDIKYNVTVGNIKTGENIPDTIEKLREYDQVILNNISSHDLEGILVTNPDTMAEDKKCGLDDLLQEYVYTYGGGLFTTGGMEEDGTTAHAYNRADMNGTEFQEMLPVQAIAYTPPVAVFIVIDISGSMLSAGADGRSKLEWAKQGAFACLDALSERDYIGLMTLDSQYGMVLDLTPRTQDGYIRQRILSITSQNGGTTYASVIDRAAQRLANLNNVDKRHIIIVTDGMPGDASDAYLKNIEDAYNNHGITLSVVGIGVTEGSQAASTILEMTETGHGKTHLVRDNQNLPDEMREDLRAPEIVETAYGDFNPLIQDPLSPLLNGVERGSDLNNRNMMQAQLGGFFGVKARQDADVILAGEYGVPIYAQWKFGEGMVGSFMCDVYGDWSADFMENDNGKRFLLNAIANLMPVENIRPSGITLRLEEENYINVLQVTASIDPEEGQYLVGKITVQTENGEVSYSLNSVSEVQGGDVYVSVSLPAESRESSVAEFIIKKGGLYTISVTVYNADGSEVETANIYKAFAYSSEFDYSVEENFSPEQFMEELAARGNGEVISEEEPWSVYSTFVTALDRVFDPRWLLLITAMVLFLLDIAVRKFKFKWPHELIREYKEKKAGKL